MNVIPDVASLVPHAGRMCLLERVLEWDESTVTLATATHRDPANPLRSDGRLRAIQLCEYGAQAMAVHGGLQAWARGGHARPGMLVSLRDVFLDCDSVHDLAGELIVTARCVHESPSAWQYDFRVSHGTRLLAHGRATVSLASGT
jgi:predicted hotdog family 3-hydroxylacyl-ACP dehydratase